MELFLTPNGRIDQPTYWRAVLTIFGMSAIIAVLTTYVSIALGLLSFATVWCWIAVHAKRFHDNGKTGWFMLILIVVGVISNNIFSSILIGISGYDMVEYQREVNAASSAGDFAGLMTLVAEAQKATILPTIVTTLITTGILGGIMGLFKTDPNDNQYGPGPAGAAVAFT
ncbi:MAG: DUF805 domain-containing protein [Hyphomonas sp.]|uniref:DUF805 domain-containing protein n=1 Tax=Hyphomonas sp. TaxID=87 RepID=UPI0017B79324|nr:DUF805 domain-containing protein [Hyphomonas sp.]MBA3067307.1 DUF805 domain-containing protein [Hyphomonas sp.]MBU3919018.1 DUF805 domain-containing protein [Alphaproteobacteria bacterium]MBU4062996.1 DUF805 domain-containing protein [Alphaproteobacteria bacterium]MBU4163577.1 DUF805 domain-containing protein [Alphaproteobacteria bacterium]